MRATRHLSAAGIMLLATACTSTAYASTILVGTITSVTDSSFSGNAPTVPTSTYLNMSSGNGGIPTGLTPADIFTVEPAGSPGGGTGNEMVSGTLQVTITFQEYNTVTHSYISGVTGSLVQDATFKADYNGSLSCSSSTGQSDCVYWGSTYTPLSDYTTSGDRDNIATVYSVMDLVTMNNGDKFDAYFYDAQDWNITPAVRFNVLSLTGGAPTPLPAALPLFATGLGGLGLLGRRRKRKNIAATA